MSHFPLQMMPRVVEDIQLAAILGGDTNIAQLKFRKRRRDFPFKYHIQFEPGIGGSVPFAFQVAFSLMFHLPLTASSSV